MCVLNYQLTFCVLICQAGTSFGANYAKLWVHFHGPQITEVPNDCCLPVLSNLSTALTVWMLLKRNRCEYRGRKAHTFAHVHTEALKHISQKCMHAPGIFFSRMEQEANAAEAQKTRYRNNTLSPRLETQKHQNKTAQTATPINIPGGVLEFQSPAKLNCETTGKLPRLLMLASQ